MDLIQFLYVVMAYYISGNKLEADGKAICNKILDTTFPIRIPYIGDVLTAVRAGKDVDYASLAFSLNEYRKEYMANPEAKVSFAQMLGMFARWFKSGSDGAYKTLAKASSLCDSLYVRNLIKSEEIDQQSVRNQLVKVNKKLGFPGKTVLNADEAKIAKASDPEGYQDYQALRRSHSQAWKTQLSNYVRSSGGKTVPYKDALKVFTKLGIEHSMPAGFTGRIDADGNWYTVDDKLINGVPAAAMFPTVVMNDSGKGDWVFQAVKTDGTLGNYFYSKESRGAKSADKFAFTGNFINKLPSFRKKWLNNIKKPFDYSSITAVSSVVIELLYLSSQRVGTKVGGNESGAGFGMSSILVKHVTVRPDKSVLISYAGKDAVKFKFVLMPGSFPDKIICEVLAHLVEGKTPRDPVFSTEKNNGTKRGLSPGSITAYFKSITGGANIHKLRTAAGTSLFKSIIESYYEKFGDRKLKPEKVMELLKAAATQVGKKLGHVTRDAKTGAMSVSPATSLKNYIDPSLQIELFQHFGVPVPTYLEKLLAVDRTLTSSLAEAYSGDSDDTTANKPSKVIDNGVAPRTPREEVEEADDRDTTRLIERFLNGEEQLSLGV